MRAIATLHPTRSRKETKGFPQLWSFAVEYLVALPIGAVLALVWANTDPETYYRVVDATAVVVNDIAMVLFFALITKEIVEATAPGGVLHPWQRAAMPIVASGGTVLLPVALFSVLVRYFDEPVLARGWTTVMPVDIAVGYFTARIIFGRHAAVPFFLLLAISATGLGFIALAIVEPLHEVRLVMAVPLMLAALASAFALRQWKVKSFWPYVIIGGGFSWSGLFFGGFHPALALLPIVPFLPHAARDPGFFVDARDSASDALSRLEIWFRHPAQAALFCFGLVNAGFQLKALDAGVWSLPIAAFVGKPLGLLAAVALGMTFGLHLPGGVHWRALIPLGFISAAGFTMTLFFAAATIGPGQTLAELKMGALLSIGGCVLAIAAARILRTGRFKDTSRSHVD